MLPFALETPDPGISGSFTTDGLPELTLFVTIYEKLCELPELHRESNFPLSTCLLAFKPESNTFGVEIGGPICIDADLHDAAKNVFGRPDLRLGGRRCIAKIDHSAIQVVSAAAHLFQRDLPIIRQFVGPDRKIRALAGSRSRRLARLFPLPFLSLELGDHTRKWRAVMRCFNAQDVAQPLEGRKAPKGLEVLFIRDARSTGLKVGLPFAQPAQVGFSWPYKIV